MADIKGLENLVVWQKAMSFAIDVNQVISPGLPQEQKWALAIQLRRSNISIPANIAEGYGRYYYQEGVWFCYLARGSLEEAYTQILLAHRLGYITVDKYTNFAQNIQELRRLINGDISFLKKSKRGEKEPGVPNQDNSVDQTNNADEGSLLPS